MKKKYYVLFFCLFAFFILFLKSHADAGNIKNPEKITKSSDGRFIAHGDGTVTDTQTGLMWAQKDSWSDLGECLDWNDSKSYVGKLNAGGHSDWRLPTIHELKSIYEPNKTNNMAYDHDAEYPLHLDSIFGDKAAYEYWSSETASSCCARVVYFFNGFVLEDDLSKCLEEGVRAVRLSMKTNLTEDTSNKLKKDSSPSGHLVDNKDGTISDTKTGLMWTQKDSWSDLGKCLDWNDSKSYVSKLNTGGHSDWQLPTIDELKSIYDESQSNNMAYRHDPQYPLHLDSIFADAAAYEYWASETAGSCCARDLDFFGFGGAGAHDRDYCEEIGVRAVRR